LWDDNSKGGNHSVMIASANGDNFFTVFWIITRIMKRRRRTVIIAKSQFSWIAGIGPRWIFFTEFNERARTTVTLILDERIMR